MWNKGYSRTSFSKVFQNSLKEVYRTQTTIETSARPLICIFKKSNPIFYLIFQNSGIFISFVKSLSPNWGKRAQRCISSIESDRKIKINIWQNFKVRYLFLRSLSQNIAILTALVTSLTQNWVKKCRNLSVMYQWW